MSDRVTAPMWKTFLIFLMPMMLANVLQSLTGTINNVYVGQMLGVDALASVSAFFPLMFFFVSFVIGLASGASVLIGQAWGAGEREKVKAVAGAAMAVTLLLGGLISVCSMFSRELLELLGTPANVLDNAADYTRVMMLTMPVTFVFLMMTSMLRGVGDTVTSLYALVLATVVGVILTPAFIRGWLGLPMLGVSSAAWAAAISVMLTMLIFAIIMRRRNHPLAPDMVFLRHLRFDRELMAKVLRIGVPAGLGIVVMALAELVLVGIINAYGSNATAAYGVVVLVLNYVQFPAISISIATSIFVAQAIGAGHQERIPNLVKTGVWMNIILTGGLVVVLYVFANPLIGLFITDPEVKRIAQVSLYIVLWSNVTFGLAGVFSGAMRASGTVLMPTAILIFSILCVEIPAAFLLSRWFGLNGVWMAFAAVFIAMLILQWSYYQFVWRKRLIKRMI